ncbi:hypothetical protein [Chachezhania sediminis]|uniref:hypothetical protein n=1 Tax=Chachezhania sediminis TaxID=2599291 RepID=UPI00131A74D9|nr:hypothetical protein [Chachezhania sediminis]
MPELIKLYIRSVAIGFGIAAVFVGVLLWSGLGGLGDLVAGSSAGWLAVFMLWFMNGIVFAGVQFAYRIMSMAQRDDTPRGGMKIMDLQPVRVEATARKQNNAQRFVQRRR